MSLDIELKQKDAGGGSFANILSRLTREDPTLARASGPNISGEGRISFANLYRADAARVRCGSQRRCVARELARVDKKAWLFQLRAQETVGRVRAVRW